MTRVLGLAAGLSFIVTLLTRTWALVVPGIDRPMNFTTEERLASRSWRRDVASERPNAEWGGR
jgi:hypothetical protein